ncbi:MAG TPA: hypothetical protein VET69_15570 [Terriglobales bacterium]|nr:hypothetical protein [Terriglobales bacterium]
MEKSFLSDGFSRVWRHQRILWWLFVVNLVLGHLSVFGMVSRWSGVLDHSLAADQLYHGFNLGRYIELGMQPGIGFGSAAPGIMAFAIISFLFILFVTGGILEAYRSPYKISTADFFQASGAYFWRFVRLLIMFVIVLIPVMIAASAIKNWSGDLSSDAAPEKLGFWVDVIGAVVIWFIAMCLRLWFDVAQVHALATGERAMLRALRRTFGMTFGNFGAVFPLYLVPSLASFIAMAMILLIWTKVPSTSVGVSFVLLEIWMLLWLGTRLWQRAGETAWYQRTQIPAAIEPVVPVVATTPGEPAPGFSTGS